MKEFVAVVGLLVVTSLSAEAQIPDLISFQGRLTDTAGVLLNGVYSVTLRLYTAPTGGAAFWTENQPTVPVVNGIHNLYLGTFTSLSSVKFDTAYWIGIEVNGGGEMTPRRQVTTAPYAFRAKYADTFTNGDTLFVNIVGDTMMGALVVSGGIRSETIVVDRIRGKSNDTVQIDSNIVINGGIHVRGAMNADSIYALGDTLVIGDNVRINGGIHISGTLRADTLSGSGAGLTGVVSSYTDTDARTAMGSKANANPLHHDRYSDTEARSAVIAAPLAGTVTATSFVGSGAGLSGIVPDTTRILISGDSIIGGTIGNSVRVITSGRIQTSDSVLADTLASPSSDTLTVGENLRVNGSIASAGSVSAAKFVGDGSGLTNVPIGAIDTSGLSSAGHHHDTTYVNVTGDSMTGNLQVTGNLIITGTVDGTDVSTHVGDSGIHHVRYTDTEAVAAMGAKTISNPLHHDRYSDTEARAAVTAAPLVGTVTATAFAGSGAGLTGIVPDTTRILISGDSITGGTIGNTVRVVTSGKIQTSDSILADTLASPSSDTLAITDNLRVHGAVSATNYYRNGLPFSGSQWTDTSGGIYYNTGRVGIGTSTPTDSLSVFGTMRVIPDSISPGGYRALIDGNGLTTYGTIAHYGGIIMRGNSILPLDFAPGDDLHKWRLGTFSVPYSGTRNFYLEYTSPSNVTTQRLVVTETGNIGIGTSSPTTALQVSGTVMATAFVGNGSGLTNLPATTDTDWSYSGETIIYRLGAYVGIGDQAPSATLHVAGATGAVRQSFIATDAANSTFRVAHPAGQVVAFGGNTNHRMDISAFDNAGASYTPRLTIQEWTGNVGIGTVTPADSLTVAGSMSVDSTTLTVNATNNRVGIGTSTPTESLTILGTMSIDSPTLFYVDAVNDIVRIGPSPHSDSFTVAGSARFGHATYGNSTLRVDAPRNRVGIATDWPNGNTLNRLEIGSNAGIGFSGTGLNSADKQLYSPADGDLEWYTTTAAANHGFAISHVGTKKIYLNILGNSYFMGGNIGIGTDTPAFPLTMGSGAYVSAGGVWTNASSRALKHDISTLSDLDCMRLLEMLDQINVVKYRYNAENSGEEHLGVIAEDAPAELVSPDKKGVPTGDAIGYLLGVVKALKEQNERLMQRLESLERGRR